MSGASGNSSRTNEENPGYFPADIPGGTIYSYTLDDMETPGGIKVKWKIRVVDGPAAARWDARQTAAIMEALQWTHRHRDQLRKARPDR